MPAQGAVKEGLIFWTTDQVASTSTRLIGALTASSGVPKDPNGKGGPRLHVLVDMASSANTSCTVGLCGLVTTGNVFTSTPVWILLGSLNGGASLTPNNLNSPSANRLRIVEDFDISAQAYARFATVDILGGTSPSITTHIGFSKDG